AKHLRHFTGERRLRSDLESFVKLGFDRLLDKFRPVTQHDGPEAVDDIDVLVAVDIPDARTLRTVRDDRIDHLLPLATKTRHDTRVGQYLAILLRKAFRFGGAPRDPVNQNVEMLLLLVRQPCRSGRLR